MSSHFPKKTVLTLFCHFRQAERSIHYAVSCPQQWSLFVAYYDRTKQGRIAEMIGMLKNAGAVHINGISRRAFSQNSFLSIIRGAAGFLANRLRNSWSFSAREVSFFSATLEHLLNVLHNTDLPEKTVLIELRLDCVECQQIIERKLIGIPELRVAAKIEHFNQSDYVGHVTFQDMGIFD